MAKKIEESLLNDIRTLLTGMAVSFKDVLEKSIEKNEELIETASKEDKKDDAKNTETLIKENKKEQNLTRTELKKANKGLKELKQAINDSGGSEGGDGGFGIVGLSILGTLATISTAVVGIASVIQGIKDWLNGKKSPSKTGDTSAATAAKATVPVRSSPSRTSQRAGEIKTAVTKGKEAVTGKQPLPEPKVTVEPQKISPSEQFTGKQILPDSENTLKNKLANRQAGIPENTTPEYRKFLDFQKTRAAQSPVTIETERSMPFSERTRSAAQSVNAARSGISPVRTAVTGGGAAIAGGILEYQMQKDNLDGKDLAESVAWAMGTAGLQAVAYDATLTGGSALASSLGLRATAAAIPLLGWGLVAGDTLLKAYNSADWGRNVAEQEVLGQYANELDKATKEGIEELKLAEKINDEGNIEKAKEIATRAIFKMANSQKSFYQWHSLIKTHEKLNDIVDMDKAFQNFLFTGAEDQQNYSIEDVASVINSVKGIMGNDNIEYGDVVASKLNSLYGKDRTVTKLIDNIGVNDTVSLVQKGPEALKEYNEEKLWSRPDEYYKKYEAEFKESAAKAEAVKKYWERRIEQERVAPWMGPKFEDEGEIKGTPSGSHIIAGENSKSEAIVSTKPNAFGVSSKIAENLNDIMLTQTDSSVQSIQRAALIMQDALQTSKAEHFDMTRAQPLASSNTTSNNVINNIVAGGGSSSEPNTQFQPTMITVMNNPELIVQRVSYDINKASLI